VLAVLYRAGVGLATDRICGHVGDMTDTGLEERIAHLIRTVEDLSDIVAKQDQEIAVLQRRVAMLMEREAERESLDGAVTIGNQPPPHY